MGDFGGSPTSTMQRYQVLENKRSSIDHNTTRRASLKVSLAALAEKGDLEAIENILKVNNAEIDSQDSQGSTALMKSIRFGKTEVTLMLLKRGANVNTLDSNGSNALNICAVYGSIEIARILLHKGANINVSNKINYNTPLFEAIKNDRIDIAELLAQHDSLDINKVHRLSNDTALISAAELGQLTVVRILIDRGADIQARNQWGQNAVMRAVAKAHEEVALLLAKHGADIYATELAGKNTLDFLKQSTMKQQELVKAFEWGLADRNASKRLREEPQHLKFAQINGLCHIYVALYMYQDWYLSSFNVAFDLVRNGTKELPQQKQQQHFNSGIPGTGNTTGAVRRGSLNYHLNQEALSTNNNNTASGRGNPFTESGSSSPVISVSGPSHNEWSAVSPAAVALVSTPAASRTLTPPKYSDNTGISSDIVPTKSLDISTIALTGDHFDAIIRGLKTDTYFEEIYLSISSLSSTGSVATPAQGIIDAMEGNTTVKILRCGAQGLDFDLSKTPPVWYVDAKYLTGCDVTVLASVLLQWPCLLESVNDTGSVAVLSGGGISSPVTHPILEAFVTIARTIPEFDFRRLSPQQSKSPEELRVSFNMKNRTTTTTANTTSSNSSAADTSSSSSLSSSASSQPPLMSVVSLLRRRKPSLSTTVEVEGGSSEQDQQQQQERGEQQKENRRGPRNTDDLNLTSSVSSGTMRNKSSASAASHAGTLLARRHSLESSAAAVGGVTATAVVLSSTPPLSGDTSAASSISSGGRNRSEVRVSVGAKALSGRFKTLNSSSSLNAGVIGLSTKSLDSNDGVTGDPTSTGTTVTTATAVTTRRRRSFKNIVQQVSPYLREGVGETCVFDLHQHAFWFALVTYDEFAHVAKFWAQTRPYLIHVTDHLGRPLLSQATNECRKSITSLFLIYERYLLTNQIPEHMSHSCEVYLATDEVSAARTPVALKFMSDRRSWQVEIDIRSKYQLDRTKVMDIYRVDNNDSSDQQQQPMVYSVGDMVKGYSRLKKGSAKFPYCLVFPAGERNLQSIVVHEFIAGEDWEAVRTIAKSVLGTLVELHTHHLVHGDLKPANIMRIGARMVLIDLDACVAIGKPIGSRYSSAYMPPEMVYTSGSGSGPGLGPGSGSGAGPGLGPGSGSGLGPSKSRGGGSISADASLSSSRSNSDRTERDDTGSHDDREEEEECSPLVKTFSQDEEGSPLTDDLPYALIAATPSFDMWSFGCVLYFLCSGEVLWHADNFDNLDHENLISLAEWSPELKQKKLSKIKNDKARNLVAQLLNLDPLKRLSAARALIHPFLSGKDAARLVGEEPEYDVFLSYRVSADLDIATRLHDTLTERGLKVFFDKRSLKPGVSWEKGFTEGLAKSRAFVPLLSRNAINHPGAGTDPEFSQQSFANIKTDSKCDNVLLEMRMALELRDFGLIDRIFPVFIGDNDPVTGTYSSYFTSGCHCPKNDAVCVELEAKLREHMERLGVGTPMRENATVTDVTHGILENQGSFIEGDPEIAFTKVVKQIEIMVHEAKVVAQRSSPHAHSGAAVVSKGNSFNNRGSSFSNRGGSFNSVSIGMSPSGNKTYSQGATPATPAAAAAAVLAAVTVADGGDHHSKDRLPNIVSPSHNHSRRNSATAAASAVEVFRRPSVSSRPALNNSSLSVDVINAAATATVAAATVAAAATAAVSEELQRQQHRVRQLEEENSNLKLELESLRKQLQFVKPMARGSGY